MVREVSDRLSVALPEDYTVDDVVREMSEVESIEATGLFISYPAQLFNVKAGRIFLMDILKWHEGIIICLER